MKHKHNWKQVGMVIPAGLATTAQYYFEECKCGKIRKMWGDVGEKPRFKGYVKKYPTMVNGLEITYFPSIDIICPHCGKKIS